MIPIGDVHYIHWFKISLLIQCSHIHNGVLFIIIMSNKSLVFGFESNCVPQIRDSLDVASLSKADFIVVPLFHPRNRRDSNGISNQRLGSGTRIDLNIKKNSSIKGPLSQILISNWKYWRENESRQNTKWNIRWIDNGWSSMEKYHLNEFKQIASNN